MKRCQFLVLVLMMAGLVCLAAPLVMAQGASAILDVGGRAPLPSWVNPATVAVVYDTWHSESGEVILEQVTVSDNFKASGDQIEHIADGARKETAEFLTDVNEEGKITIWCGQSGEILLEEITACVVGMEIWQAREHTDAQGCLFLYFLNSSCGTGFSNFIVPAGCTKLGWSYVGIWGCWDLRDSIKCGGNMAYYYTATSSDWSNYTAIHPGCTLPGGYT